MSYQERGLYRLLRAVEGPAETDRSIDFSPIVATTRELKVLLGDGLLKLLGQDMGP